MTAGFYKNNFSDLHLWWRSESDFCKNLSKNYSQQCGLYAPSIGRFILKEENDIKYLLQTSKLLATKINTVIIHFSEEVPFKSSNSIEWSLATQPFKISEARKSRRIFGPFKNDVLVKMGYPQLNLPDNLKENFEFFEFVHKVSKGIFLTDLYLNPNDELHFSEMLGEQTFNYFSYNVDQSHIPKGFSVQMNRILFFSNSIDEALRKINLILKLDKNDLLNNEYVAFFRSLYNFRGDS